MLYLFPVRDHPGGQQKTWLQPVNRAWLRARGLPSEGKAKELKERVAEYMCSGKDYPILPPPAGTNDDLHALIGAMYGMVKSIMIFEQSQHDVDMADFCIKRFLTHLVHCNKTINPDAKNPFWISSYTYPCLLNLPAQMKEFGRLKNVWEGGCVVRAFFLTSSLCMVLLGCGVVGRSRF